MLVLRVIGVDNQNCLPATFSLLDVVHLKGGGDDQHGERQPLRVDTGLDELLGRAHGRAANDGEGNAHAGNPRGEDDGVAVVATPLHEALVGGLVLADDLLGALAGVPVLHLGILAALELCGEALGIDNGAKGTRRGDEEAAEGQRQTAEGWVAARSKVDTAQAESYARGAANETSLENLIVVRLLLLGADDLHDGGGGSVAGKRSDFRSESRSRYCRALGRPDDVMERESLKDAISLVR